MKILKKINPFIPLNIKYTFTELSNILSNPKHTIIWFVCLPLSVVCTLLFIIITIFFNIFYLVYFLYEYLNTRVSNKVIWFKITRVKFKSWISNFLFLVFFEKSKKLAFYITYNILKIMFNLSGIKNSILNNSSREILIQNILLIIIKIVFFFF